MASGRAEGPRAPPRRAAGFGVTNYPVFQPPPLTTCRGEAEHRRGFAPIRQPPGRGHAPRSRLTRVHTKYF